MSILKYLAINAPFLLSYGPAVITAAACLLIWKLLFKQTTSDGGKTVRPRASQNGAAATGSPKDEDDYVFMDNAEEINLHPTTQSVGEEGAHIPYIPEKYSEDEMVLRSKQFYEDVNKRRTVRFFSSNPVPLEVIKNIIRAAGMYSVPLL